MRRVFKTSISAEHPILRDHLVHGKPLMPGLAFIDMLYQLVRSAYGINPVDYGLEKLTIFNPLAIEPGQTCDLEIAVEVSEHPSKTAGQTFAIEVTGRFADAIEMTPQVLTIVKAQLAPVTDSHKGSANPRIDIASLKAQATKTVDMDAIYAAARGRGLVHRGLIKAEGQVFTADDWCLAELNVMDSDVHLHPAIIDGAAMASEALHDFDYQNLFLPVFYERFWCRQAMQKACYALIERRTMKTLEQVHSFDIAFYNIQGELIGELNGITAKKVREPAHINGSINGRVKAADEEVGANIGMKQVSAAGSGRSNGLTPIVAILEQVFNHYLDAAVDFELAFFDMGLQSSQLLSIVADLEKAFDVTLSQTLLFEHNTLQELVQSLSSQLDVSQLVQQVKTDLVDSASTGLVSIPSQDYFFSGHEGLLNDHRVLGQPALMGVVYPCLAIDACQKHISKKTITLKNIQFLGGPVYVDKSRGLKTTVNITEDDSANVKFSVIHNASGENAQDRCCEGTILFSDRPTNTFEDEQTDIEQLLAGATPLSSSELAQLYQQIPQFDIGDTLKVIDKAYRTQDGVIFQIDVTGKRLTNSINGKFALEPLILNACYFLDAGSQRFDANTHTNQSIFVPLLIESLTLFSDVPSHCFVICQLETVRDDFIAANFTITNMFGEHVVAIQKASLKRVSDTSKLGFLQPPFKGQETVLPHQPQTQSESMSNDDIAIVGLSGAYPHAKDVAAFWQNIQDGKDCISEIPAERWDWRDFYAESDQQGTSSINSKWGGFLQDVDQFSPLFFNISPTEAAYTDPQGRLFLEHCWHAVEDAGYGKKRINNSGNKVAVYAGVMSQDYPMFAAEAGMQGHHMGLPSSVASIANRVSYFFDFNGPSLTVDTMCSSSLTAVVMACDALHQGKVDAALAGGVNLILHPNRYLLLSQGQFISSKGRCESFGLGGDGYIPSEGVGVVMLKRRSDAEAKGDHIYALIKGCAVNHGGRASGFTVPNPKAQSQVISQALKDAGVEPQSISYIEAHGTGTSLGDPVEIKGLLGGFSIDGAFIEGSSAGAHQCAIGSVKSNIGHCESAAGIAGLTKLIFQLRNRTIAPSIHSQQLNPAIDFASTPFYVPQESKPWLPNNNEPLRAGLSSFGAGGANVHLIVEEYIESEFISSGHNLSLPFVLSAKTPAELQKKVAQMVAYLSAHPDIEFNDILYTLLVGRDAMEERLALLPASREALLTRLKAYQLAPENQQEASVFADSIRLHQSYVNSLKMDESFQQKIANWITDKNYAALLPEWVKGIDIDWSEIVTAADVKLQRVSLPAYPFVKQRCWYSDLLPELSGSRLVKLEKSQEIGTSSKDFSAPTAPSREGPQLLAPVWQVSIIDQQPVAPDDSVLVMGDAAYQEQAEALGWSFVTLQHDEDTHQIIQKLQQQTFTHLIWGVPSSASNAFITDVSSTTALAQFIPDATSVTRFALRLIKAVNAIGYEQKSLRWSVITTLAQKVLVDDHLQLEYAGIHGLFGTQAKEKPHWHISLIDTDNSDTFSLRDAGQVAYDARGRSVAYRAGEWYQPRLLPIAQRIPPNDVYRQGGVYIVVGGAGGVGQVWSEWLVRRYQANVIWFGRRQQDQSISEKLDHLGSLGPKPEYRSVDVSNLAELKSAIAVVKQQYGAIHGVVHSALVFFEEPISELSETSLCQCLAAKVDVSVNLAMAFESELASEPLDFMLYFSSIASLINNPNQAHYTAGCQFKDHFAAYLQQRWSEKQRSNPAQTLVKTMNWGFWKKGGDLDVESYEDYARLGIGLIEMQEGMDALAQLLASDRQQLAFLKTSKSILIEGVLPNAWLNFKQATFKPSSTNEQDQTLSLVQQKDGFIPTNATFQTDAEFEHWMEQYLGHGLFQTLQSLGALATHNMAVTDICDKVQDKYAQWMLQSLRLLQKLGFIQWQEQWVCIAEEHQTQDPFATEWQQQKQVWMENEARAAQINLVDATLERLGDIVTGAILATDIMFPSGSMAAVEGIYKNNKRADHFNALLADVVVNYIENLPLGKRKNGIRILEFGAGTGGTSALLLQRLKPYQKDMEEYLYTDISKAFLHHAEERFQPASPFLKCQLFDVNTPPLEQGIALDSYDIVIGTNVLHATQNIRESLDNIQPILLDKGLLILNEVSHDGGIYAHLTFGLLDGWWAFDDAPVRVPGSPALFPATWQRVLKNQGFDAVWRVEDESLNLGQQIIVAQSGGLFKLQGNKLAQLPKKPLSEPSQQRSPSDTLLSQSVVSPAAALITTPVISDAEIKDAIEDIVIQKLSASLRIDTDVIGITESFADYGLDSILGVRFVEELNAALSEKYSDIKLDTTIIFDYNAVESLVEHIVAEYGGQLKPATVVPVRSESTDSHVPNLHAPDLQEASSQRLNSHSPKAEVSTVQKAQKSPIAIVGISGRFAKSPDVNALWENLVAGNDLVDTVTRWDLDSLYGDIDKSRVCNAGGFVDDIEYFDPSFFSMSGKEAQYTDPKQRLFLEACWNALEDAGHANIGVNSNEENLRCGIFVGCEANEYHQLITGDAPEQAMWGNANSVLPARLAYFLDLKGPAVAVDTACSSGLVAVHQACQSLWLNDTDMCLAGGISLETTSHSFAVVQQVGMLSPDGRCFTFDARANGFVPGEGVGVLVLKTLTRAEQDGDQIYGLIRGIGLNQDGRTNGITAPSAKSQESLERQVYTGFGVNAGDIQVVEAHGTGTELGDPIEWNALTRSFRQDTDKKQFCAIGSIKSNLGHTKAASGLASMLKIVMSLKHKQIPASLHFEQGNPNIDFESSPFYVNTALTPWPENYNESGQAIPRLATISSFGMSGTNVHVVVEEAPVRTLIPQVRTSYLVPLSARNQNQLKQQAEQLRDYLAGAESTLHLGDVSYSLMTGRKHFNHRLVCLVQDHQDLLNKLNKWLKKAKPIRFMSAKFMKKIG